MADVADKPVDLAAPIVPTGYGVADLEIAREQDALADAGQSASAGGPADYWLQPAELHRRHDDEQSSPDDPVRLGTTRAAQGTLGDVLDQWNGYADDERRRYVIHLGGGTLTYSTMEAFRVKGRTPRD